MNNIWCCGCKKVVFTQLVGGDKVYPHRKDLYKLKFWECPTCSNFVGTQHKTKTPLKPLGCIPTPELKVWRRKIHAVMDPLWKAKLISRSKLYSLLSEFHGKTYHTAELRSLADAECIYMFVVSLKKDLEEECQELKNGR